MRYEARKTGKSAAAVKKVGNGRKRVERRLGRSEGNAAVCRPISRPAASAQTRDHPSCAIDLAQILVRQGVYYAQ